MSGVFRIKRTRLFLK